MSLACLGLFAAACGGDPASTPLHAAVTTSRTAFQFVQLFNVAVLKSTARNGQPVSCGDIPNPFPFSSGQLRFDAKRSITWNQQGTAVSVEEILVSAEETLLIAVEGVVGWNAGGAAQHAVVRGCEENLRFAKSSKANSVRIDARPTVGKSCAHESDCEPTLNTCLQGLEFAGGYCTTVGCARDEECVPGSRCVTGNAATNGNFCARICSGSGDCDAGSQQECVRRLGPSGCGDVCVRATWNASASCP